MNSVIAALMFFAGFHSPNTAVEQEACRGAEVVTLLNYRGWEAKRSECVLKWREDEVVSGYWMSNTIGKYYNVLGCVNKEDTLVCRGYTIYVPTCKGCVYGMVTKNDEITANYNKIKNILRD